MPGYAEARNGKPKDPAALLVQLLQPAALIPLTGMQWRGVIESLLEEFLRHFEPATLSRLLKHQRALPASASPGVRAARLASELTAFHKVCQMLARNPLLPATIRSALAPLEQMPPASIPDENLVAAIALTARARPGLCCVTGATKVARGSVADVFRFRGSHQNTDGVALKFVRPDAIPRIRREASILKRMAGETARIGAFAGHNFARTLAEALRDASGALLREIDFAGEAANLRQARAMYMLNQRVRVPMVMGPPLKQGIYMEFTGGSPLLDAPLDQAGRREASRLLFRSLILEPLFSGLPESIFHADPHAGNILLQTHKSGNVIVLLDWSQAGRLTAPARHALLELCLHCATGSAPPVSGLERLLGSFRKSIRIPLPTDAGDPLRVALDIMQQLVVAGHPVPLDLILLRKSLLTAESVAHHLDPSMNPWLETLIYAASVLASEGATRMWSIPFPWLDRPGFLRSGLPTRMLAAHCAGTMQKYLCNRIKCVDISPDLAEKIISKARDRVPGRH
jgi:ubiquinone biosynthesis protein